MEGRRGRERGPGRKATVGWQQLNLFVDQSAPFHSHARHFIAQLSQKVISSILLLLFFVVDYLLLLSTNKRCTTRGKPIKRNDWFTVPVVCDVEFEWSHRCLPWLYSADSVFVIRASLNIRTRRAEYTIQRNNKNNAEFIRKKNHISRDITFPISYFCFF